jgi:hypothetical protein
MDTTEIEFTPRYKHPLFKNRCIDYALFGYIFIKGFFKTISDKTSIKIKYYNIGIDNDDELYCDYHFYIEFSIKNKKYILDNECAIYTYKEYKEKYKPTYIKTLSVTKIKDGIKCVDTTEISDKYRILCIMKDVERLMNELLQDI